MSYPITQQDWELYLSRPFSLFGASAWNEWYVRDNLQRAFGTIFTEGLFIEVSRGVVSCYRTKEELDAFKEALKQIVRTDLERTREILERGESLNLEAISRIHKGEVGEFARDLDAYIELALYAGVFPFFGGEALVESESAPDDLIKKCEGLRSVSLYPDFLSRILIPSAARAVEASGGNPEDVEFLTVREILAGSVMIGSERKKATNTYFLYQYSGGTESVSYVSDPSQVVATMEGVQDESSEVSGVCAFGGKVSGRARLILTNETANLKFEQGDILIAPSTNPALLGIMKKAGAIVTDEGGMLSHATIIAREFSIPCVVGTKRATLTFKDGDLVEVDAEKGIVRKIG